MNIADLRTLRRLVPRAVLDRADQLSNLLGNGAQHGRRLLVAGTPGIEEPWHLAAHLDLAARRHALPTLSPTLVRNTVPAGAPAHLDVPLSRLGAADNDDIVLIIGRTPPGSQLLWRLEQARRRGALIVNIETHATELELIAQESLTLDTVTWPAATMMLEQRVEVVQHLVGDVRTRSRSRAGMRR